MRHRLRRVFVLMGLLMSGGGALAACMEGVCEATPFAFPIALSACIYEPACPGVLLLRGVPSGTWSFWTNLGDDPAARRRWWSASRRSAATDVAAAAG
jgi:hypothetical protein